MNKRSSRPSPPLKVAVISLGCAKNLVDTEVMCGNLATSGFLLTNSSQDADVLLINTCSFIADARSEAEREIRLGLQWKRQQHGRRLVVAGCLPQRNLKQTRAQYPGVDRFLALDDVPNIAVLLTELLQKDGRQEPDVGFKESSFIYDESMPRLQLTPQNYAYMKIAEGCDHACRFCAIPAIRGRQRSRSIDSILREAEMLLEQGVCELNLIAQDTTRYGHDRDDGATIETLLEQLDRIEGEFWVRLLYTHPRFFRPELIEVFRGAKHLVPYVDIPLQHISDHMLHAMGRGMGAMQTRDLMQALRQQISGVVVRSTVLVGYPGETEEDFRELYEFVKAYRFDRLGVFEFSPEEGTPAAELHEQFVPPSVTEERRQHLLELQQELAGAANAKLAGRDVRVVVDGVDEDGTWVGRTAGDAPDVDNLVHFSGPEDCLNNGFCDVRVTDTAPYDLYGDCRSI